MTFTTFKDARTIIVSAAVIFLAAAADLPADIYMYLDAEGTMHFTDSPKNPDYQLYLEEKKAHAEKSWPTDIFDHHIQEAASRYNIAFPLLKAVIKVESNFNPKAVSKAGAKGLMQVMPANFTMCNITDPFDPLENIMGGSFYLRKMLDRFDGSLSLALAAYNAGPTRVAEYQQVPPYPETEKYVQKVMNYYAHYKNL